MLESVKGSLRTPRGDRDRVHAGSCDGPAEARARCVRHLPDVFVRLTARDELG
jgi:hypothetical protein